MSLRETYASVVESCLHAFSTTALHASSILVACVKLLGELMDCVIMME